MLRRDFFKRILGGTAAAAVAAVPGAKVAKSGTVVRQLNYTFKVNGFNAVTQEWMELDAVVLRAARARLRNWKFDPDLQVIRGPSLDEVNVELA